MPTSENAHGQYVARNEKEGIVEVDQKVKCRQQRLLLAEGYVFSDPAILPKHGSRWHRRHSLAALVVH